MDEAKSVPRVTPEDVEAEIVGEAYFVPDVPMLEKRVTIATLTLKNGFIVVGKAIAAMPEYVDEEIGRAAARADAVNQIWPVLVFRLRDQLKRDADA